MTQQDSLTMLYQGYELFKGLNSAHVCKQFQFVMGRLMRKTFLFVNNLCLKLEDDQIMKFENECLIMMMMF